jgi:ribose transport system permease protein
MVEDARPPVATPAAATMEAGIGVSPGRLRWWQLEQLGSLWTLVILLAIVAVFSVITPEHSFFSVRNLRDTLLNTSEVLMIALAETFVIIAAGIDLSVGAVLTFSSVAAALVMVHLSGTPAEEAAFQFPREAVGIPLGIAVGLAAGTAFGWGNGMLIARLRMPPFIVTLGATGVAAGGADLLTGGTNVPNVPTDLQTWVGAGNVFAIVPVPVFITFIVVVIAHLLLSATRFGRHTYAIGSNIEAARLAGIDVERHLVLVYTIAGFLSALAGIIDLARFDTATIAGHATDNLTAIAAVVIGGTSLFGGVGSIVGTVIGTFIPATLQNGFVIMGVQPFWSIVSVGAIIILAVFIDQYRRAQRTWR